ncbi:MAG: endopeptidase La [Dictyoglomi bacterium]|nr:endopeptidase La [Dictyoglomota bacterium]
MSDENRIPEILPILPLRETVIFPSMVAPVVVGRERSIRLIDEVAVGSKMFGVVAQKDPQAEDPTPEQIYNIGTVCTIIRMLKFPDGTTRLLLQGISRIRINQILETEPYLKAQVAPIQEVYELTIEIQGLMRNALDLFQKVVSMAPYLAEEAYITAMNIQEPNRLADFIAANLNINTAQKQEILETIDVKERLQKVTYFLNSEIQILEVGKQIQSEIKTEMDKRQREYILREQLKAIQKELGEVDEQTKEINELREKIEQAGMPEEVRREAERELDRLSQMMPGAAEYTVSRTYLDWLINLPWSKSTEDTLDIERAKEILDEDHYDLEKVKNRILEFLAVRKLKNDTHGPILCFVGPPGVGKTSLGMSIARAMGREFVRISLGGVRDEAEIRGHRRTYVGALPGRIIQAIRKAGTNNPVFMLDEIDKLGLDFRGDPAAALLEVLDPQQNNKFVDHYLDVPFDLSKVFFITTANMLDTIPPALLDRMEVITLPGYTEYEKLEIAKRYLIPRQISENGLKPEMVTFDEEAIKKIIREYTREAGVRNLEREIGSVLRKIAQKVAQGETGPFNITVNDIEKYLGIPRYHFGLAGERDEVGVATGLAWTEAGGDILFIEAALVPGKGGLILTGKLGEVMQESARAALTYVRSKSEEWGIESNFFEKWDIHIHVPAGAIPKDGPSAGVTMATALASAIRKIPVRKDIGMTGEITIRGKVLPVGGIREKVLAAHRAGLKTVMLPKDNERDLEEVPQIVKEDIDFIFIEHADEAINMALLMPELVK